MSSAIAIGCSLIASRELFVTEVPSSVVLEQEEEEEEEEEAGGHSFLSSKQFPHFFSVDLNANDCAFPSLSKVEDAGTAPLVTSGDDLELTGHDRDQGTRSQAFPGASQHLDISGVVCNQTNFVDNEIKTREESEENALDKKTSDVSSRYMNLRKKSKRSLDDHPRQKRQAARDMCRPLKQWLYSHRDTPYPSKSEKQDLALRSHMTLTQVSNWFANARRRLKNTVAGGPEVTWARRIKLYNRFVVGNQELLSISSDDTMWNEDDETMDAEGSAMRKEQDERGRQCHPESEAFSRKGSRDCSERVRGLFLESDTEEEEEEEESGSPTGLTSNATNTPAKFKQGILQRYLTDACDRVTQVNAKKRDDMEVDEEDDDDDDDDEEEEEQKILGQGSRFRNASGSLSSHDYEDISLSAPDSPTKDQQSTSNEIQDDAKDSELRHSSTRDRDDLYWKEISAALALTTLAMRSRFNSGSSRASSARI